jgi:uncharacterized protein (DUF2267 family)
LVRGVYYDQFEPAKQPTDWDSAGFISEVSHWLSDVRPVDAEDAVQTVFALLSRHLPPGQVEKIRQSLPQDLRAVWSSSERATH